MGAERVERRERTLKAGPWEVAPWLPPLRPEAAGCGCGAAAGASSGMVGGWAGPVTSTPSASPAAIESIYHRKHASADKMRNIQRGVTAPELYYLC